MLKFRRGMPALAKKIKGVKQAEKKEGDGEEMEVERYPHSCHEEKPSEKGDYEIGEPGKLVQVHHDFSGHCHWEVDSLSRD